MPAILPRAFAAAVAALAACAEAPAQGLAPPPPANAPRSPVCLRLETQLAALDRTGGDARSEQIQRYEEAASKQQAELDRAVAQSRRLNCEGGSFFLFGGGGQSPQCDQLNRQMQNMRANLDRMLAGLAQLQGSGSGRDEQRRAILAALGQNECGPQYRTASAPVSRPRTLFESMFGTSESPDAGIPGEPAQSGTYRTLCVRTCDGFYFPVSYATVPGRFQDDERACQRMCPGSEAVLFTHRNPGEDISRAVSLSGRPYTELPSAFRYRQEVNAACTCKRAGETWADALGQDQTVQQGDIVVTDEKAKALSQPPAPKAARPEPPRGRARAGDKPPEAATAPAPPNAGAAAAPPDAQPPRTAAAPPSDKPRSVGPQFLPTR